MKQWELHREDLIEPNEYKILKSFLTRQYDLANLRGAFTAIQDRAICFLAFYTGLRRSEIANLDIQDLYLTNDRPYIVVRHGKGDKHREVLISNDCRAMLKAFIKVRRESTCDALFVPQRGERYTGDGIYRVFKTAMEEAGLPPKSIHKARHYNGMMLYSASKDIRFVQKQLGHSRITTSQVYVDIVAEDAQENLENLDKALKT
jgi:site-specific recombinase XerC